MTPLALLVGDATVWSITYGSQLPLSVVNYAPKDINYAPREHL